MPSDFYQAGSKDDPQASTNKSYGFASASSPQQAAQAAATLAQNATPQVGFSSDTRANPLKGTQFDQLPENSASTSAFRSVSKAETPGGPLPGRYPTAIESQDRSVQAPPLPTAVVPSNAGAGLGVVNPAAVVPEEPRGVTRVGNSFSGKDLKEDMSSPLTSIDMKGNNESLARTNAIRQSMLDDPNLGGGGPRGFVIPNSQAVETQNLFDKWANEALVKGLMDRKDGANAAAAVFNAPGHNANQLAGIDAQGRNQQAVVSMQGQNQLAGLDVQGRTQRDVAQLQGDNQLAGLDKQGQNALAVADKAGVNRKDVQKMDNEGRLAVGKQQIEATQEHKPNPYLAMMAKLAEMGTPEQQSEVYGHLRNAHSEYETARRGGQQGAANGAPHAEGTRLTGKDGRSYVVKNGQPVLAQ